MSYDRCVGATTLHKSFERGCITGRCALKSDRRPLIFQAAEKISYCQDVSDAEILIHLLKPLPIDRLYVLFSAMLPTKAGGQQRVSLIEAS